MTPTFSGECQLVAWADSNARGPTITFRLQSSEELEAFKGLTLARKGMAGDRFAVVVVLIHDDETLDGDDGGLPLPFDDVTPEPDASKFSKPCPFFPDRPCYPPLCVDGCKDARYEPPLTADAVSEVLSARKGHGKFPDGLTGLAVRWSQDQDHRQWLEQEFGVPVPDEATVKDLICSICGIESRTELNSNRDAAQIYIESIKEPYAESRALRGLDE